MLSCHVQCVAEAHDAIAGTVSGLLSLSLAQNQLTGKLPAGVLPRFWTCGLRCSLLEEQLVCCQSQVHFA